jgi:hypothetical protein
MSIFSQIIRMLTPKVALYLGGGDSPSTPDQTTQTVVNIPPYIRPYIESLLGQGQALTTGAQYEPYDTSQRFQSTDPLQQQAYDAAGNLTTSPLLGQSANMVNSAVAGAQTASNQGSQYATSLMNQGLGYGATGAAQGQQLGQDMTDPSAVASYMSPYTQNVINVQKQQALQDYQEQLPQMQSAATKAGAYGGSRQAVVQGAMLKDLNQNLQNIQATGDQNAYNSAMANMQAANSAAMQGTQLGLSGVGQGINAAQLGLQSSQAGTNAALQGANTLGQLGSTQFGQQQDILNTQNQLGTQMQAQGQQAKDFDYQQYLDELNFPYTQLSFMSDLTRGLPMSQSTVYQNSTPQSMGLSQLAGLGMTAYGLANRAKGGVVHKYADGGPVAGEQASDPEALDSMNPYELSSVLKQMPDQTLMQYMQLSKNLNTRSAIDSEMQRRQHLRAAVQKARGGIVALASGGAVPYPVVDPRDIPPEGQGAPLGGRPAMPFAGTYMPPAQLPVDTSKGPFFNPAVISRVDPKTGKQLPPAPETPPVPNLPAGMANPDDINLLDAGVAQGVAPPSAMDNPSPQAQATGDDGSAGGSSSASASVRGSAGASGAGGAPALPATTSYDDYISQINKNADQSLNEKMYLDAMHSGLDQQQAQLAVRDKRDKMDALIAAGAAMMRGRSLAEGLGFAGAAGSRALRQAAQAHDALADNIQRAQQEQMRYELSLKNDDRKAAQESYQNWLNYNQKNTALGIQYKLGMARVGAIYASAAASRSTASARGIAAMVNARARAAGLVDTAAKNTPEFARLQALLKDPQASLSGSDPNSPWSKQYQTALAEYNAVRSNLRKSTYADVGLTPAGGIPDFSMAQGPNQ